MEQPSSAEIKEAMIYGLKERLGKLKARYKVAKTDKQREALRREFALIQETLKTI
tara:strand:- start:14858 stop:15022 length:165 start_codon:yes stop_codon:yes gene_type:complete